MSGGRSTSTMTRVLFFLRFSFLIFVSGSQLTRHIVVDNSVDSIQSFFAEIETDIDLTLAQRVTSILTKKAERKADEGESTGVEGYTMIT